MAKQTWFEEHRDQGPFARPSWPQRAAKPPKPPKLDGWDATENLLWRTSRSWAGSAVIGAGLILGALGCLLGSFSIAATINGGSAVGGVVICIASIFQAVLFVAVGLALGDLRSVARTNAHLTQLMAMSLDLQRSAGADGARAADLLAQAVGYQQTPE